MPQWTRHTTSSIRDNLKHIQASDTLTFITVTNSIKIDVVTLIAKEQKTEPRIEWIDRNNKKDAYNPALFIGTSIVAQLQVDLNTFTNSLSSILVHFIQRHLKSVTPLPSNILECQTLTSFRRHLKTYYFQSAYPAPPSVHPQCTLILFWDIGAIQIIYLLTRSQDNH